MDNFERPAYPTNGRMHSEMTGLTKRELFAMAAMQGIVSFSTNYLAHPDSAEETAKDAVNMADQLLKALES